MTTNLTALIVEDDVTNRVMLETLLNKRGFTVSSCGSGQEAVELVVTGGQRFDVILMDLMLPGLNGLEAAQEIRQAPGGQDCCILCLTAQVGPDLEEQCLAAGCDEMVRKPFRPRDLVTLILSKVASAL